MPLCDILKSPTHRIKLKVELAKQHSRSDGPFECYICPKHFGKSERFSTHDDLVAHHKKHHPPAHPYPVPLQHKEQTAPKPKVISKVDIEDFHIWWIIFKSKYPHFEFVKRHRSSWSSGEQYILLDTKRKVKVVMTIEQMKEKLDKISHSLIQASA